MMKSNNPNHTPFLDDAFVLGLRSNQSHYVGIVLQIAEAHAQALT